MNMLVEWCWRWNCDVSPLSTCHCSTHVSLPPPILLENVSTTQILTTKRTTMFKVLDSESEIQRTFYLFINLFLKIIINCFMIWTEKTALWWLRQKCLQMSDFEQLQTRTNSYFGKIQKLTALAVLATVRLFLRHKRLTWNWEKMLNKVKNSHFMWVL